MTGAFPATSPGRSDSLPNVVTIRVENPRRIIVGVLLKLRRGRDVLATASRDRRVIERIDGVMALGGQPDMDGSGYGRPSFSQKK